MKRTSAAVGNLEELLYTIVGGDSLCTAYSHNGEEVVQKSDIEGEKYSNDESGSFHRTVHPPEKVIASFVESAKNPDATETDDSAG